MKIKGFLEVLTNFSGEPLTVSMPTPEGVNKVKSITIQSVTSDALGRFQTTVNHEDFIKAYDLGARIAFGGDEVEFTLDEAKFVYKVFAESNLYTALVSGRVLSVFKKAIDAEEGEKVGIPEGK